MSLLFLILIILWFLFYSVLFAVDHKYIELKPMNDLLHFLKLNNIPFNNIYIITMAILVIFEMISVAIK